MQLLLRLPAAPASDVPSLSSCGHTSCDGLPDLPTPAAPATAPPAAPSAAATPSLEAFRRRRLICLLGFGERRGRRRVHIFIGRLLGELLIAARVRDSRIPAGLRLIIIVRCCRRHILCTTESNGGLCTRRFRSAGSTSLLLLRANKSLCTVVAQH